MKTIIINVGTGFGTIDGVITPAADLRTIVNQALKRGAAHKIIDNESTLMYRVD